MSVQVRGTSANIADVDSSNRLLVKPSSTIADAAPTVMITEVDPGTQTGNATRRRLEVGPNGRLRAGIDQILFHELFTTGQQNSSQFLGLNATMNAAQSIAGLIINSNNTLSSSAHCRIYSQRFFQMQGDMALEAIIRARLTLTPQSGQVIEFGLQAMPSNVADPQDGIYFRYNSAGVLQGVVMIYGAEVATASLPIPAAGVAHKYSTVITPNAVEFWIDDTLQGIVDVPAAAANTGVFGHGQLIFRMYNATAVAGAQQLQVFRCTVTQWDIHPRLPELHLKALAGYNAIQQSPAGTSGQLANRANSTAPISATLSNTAAGYTTLGGAFQFAAVAGAETDYALFGFLVPAQSVTVAGKNLVILGINISAYNTGAAVATTPTLLEWYAAVGGTGVSLAGTETALGAAPSKGARRIALGVQSFAVGDPVGKVVDPVSADFPVPLVAHPGEYVHIILRMPLGAATASQIIRGNVRIVGYWE